MIIYGILLIESNKKFKPNKAIRDINLVPNFHVPNFH